jgi:arabinoxylan arabinofuranohydrolase
MSKIIFIFLSITFFSGFAQQPSSAEKDRSAYLFVYFTGNAVVDESIHYAVSIDGLNFFALNNNKPVVDSKAISSTGGVRDPHILRSNDGKTFYMVVTDMTSSKGWNSNRAMVLMRSDDLVYWQSSVINMQKRFSNQDSLLRVWAPQTIYDPQKNKYMVYWSMKHGRKGEDIIYYAYANEAFTDLESEPKQLFFPANGKSCIDGDIVFKDGVYHLFYKTEGHGNGIRKATSTSLTSGKWSERENYLQQTKDAVEGACVFKLHNSPEYILMYDVYTKGRYEFTRSKTLDSFTLVENVSMDFHPRHGAVISITRDELNRLIKQWGRPERFRE